MLTSDPEQQINKVLPLLNNAAKIRLFAVTGATLMLAFLAYSTTCITIIMHACRYMLQSIYRVDQLVNEEESLETPSYRFQFT